MSSLSSCTNTDTSFRGIDTAIFTQATCVAQTLVTLWHTPITYLSATHDMSMLPEQSTCDLHLDMGELMCVRETSCVSERSCSGESFFGGQEVLSATPTGAQLACSCRQEGSATMVTVLVLLLLVKLLLVLLLLLLYQNLNKPCLTMQH